MGERRIRVSLAAQTLELFEGGELQAAYPISTARNGPGEKKDSERTPRGLHLVRAKIGAGAPSGAVFAGRRPTGEVCTPELYGSDPKRDWILSRILWLSGLERGRNRLGEVDSMQRFIYIHGTPEEQLLGTPASHGCVRMANADVIELFDQVPVGTLVEIDE